MSYKVTIGERDAKIIAKAVSLYYEKLAENHMSVQLTESITDADKKEYENLMYRSLEITQFLMDELLPKFEEERLPLPSFAKL